MAVANTKSTVVGNGDANPVVMTSARIRDANLREQAATIETVAADDAGSVYRLFRVPSNARISQILCANDALTNMSTADLGVYQTAANGGAVVNVSLFADAVDLTAAHGYVDYIYEKTATNIDKIEKQLWELLGLATDPNREYDICWTATTNDPTVAATLSGIIRYATNQ